MPEIYIDDTLFGFEEESLHIHGVTLLRDPGQLMSFIDLLRYNKRVLTIEDDKVASILQMDRRESQLLYAVTWKMGGIPYIGRVCLNARDIQVLSWLTWLSLPIGYKGRKHMLTLLRGHHESWLSSVNAALAGEERHEKTTSQDTQIDQEDIL